MHADDEANLTEIEILPDGRICVFGMSAEVLAMVSSLRTIDEDPLAKRLSALQAHAVTSAVRKDLEPNGDEVT